MATKKLKPTVATSLPTKGLGFLSEFKKKLSTHERIGTTFADPLFWIDTGNWALNKIASNSFTGGIPQGRMVGVCGPSGGGKSFVMANVMKNAQRDHGAFVVLIDTEKAGNVGFYESIGVDVGEESFLYLSAGTHGDVITAMSEFYDFYKASYGIGEAGPPVLVAIDSISGLVTERDSDLFEKGEMKGAQGQDQKQGKQLMKILRAKFARLNVTWMFSMHVYANQDITNGKGLHVLTEAYKYELSQVFLITNKALKTDEVTFSDAKGAVDKTEKFAGVSMRVTGMKSRFSQNNRSAEFDVPYKTGLARNSNLLQLLLPMGVVRRSGAWYEFVEEDTGVVHKFYEKDLTDELVQKMLRHSAVMADEERFQHGIEDKEGDE